MNHHCDICGASFRSEVALANHDRDAHRGGKSHADSEYAPRPTSLGSALALGVTPRKGERGDPRNN